LQILLVTGALEADAASEIREEAVRLGVEGVQLDVACLSAPESPVPGLQLDECPWIGSAWRRGLEIRRWHRRGTPGPDLLHVRGASAIEAGLALAEHLEVPYLIELQGTLPVGARIRLSRRWFRGLIVGNPDVAHDLVHGLGLGAEWVIVLPAGLLAPDTIPRRSLLPRQVRVIGMEVDATDGPSVLTVLRSARKLLDEGFDLEFVISGTPGAEAEVRRAIDHLRISDRTTLAEPSAVGDAFWSVFDVYCRASGVADAGLDVEHAMLHGVPVVVPDVLGLRGWVENGRSGLMVPPGDASALTDAIRSLLSDPIRARSMGQAGRDTILERCDPARRASDLARLYRQIRDALGDPVEIPESISSPAVPRAETTR
jgi:glycosyltransferase involved in cell wall biosynthesis